MQIKEAFKLGFLARCVEEGLTPDQTHALAKSAADCVEKQALGVGSAIPVAAAALASVPATGGLMAYLANQATDTDATEVEDVKQRELTDTYQRMAEQLQRRKQLQAYKQKRKRTGQVFL